MTDVNLSAVLYKKGDLRLEERPIQEPKHGEVQVSIHSVGLCGTDIHFWTNGDLAGAYVLAPMVLGHESSGTVTKLGPGVTHLKVGDRVALEPNTPCRFCDYCKRGRYNLCPNGKYFSTPPNDGDPSKPTIDGDLARFHCHAADFCYKLPDNVSFEEGALVEPLSVGVHSCRRAGVSLGHYVLIGGAGTIGLVNLLTAKAMGAAKIIVTDIAEHRLVAAKKLGADYVYKIDTKKSARALADDIISLLGRAPDITIECSGAESSIQTGMFATKDGGNVTLVGIGPAEVKVPLAHTAFREVDIRGVNRYPNSYPVALEMVSSGAINVKPLVTHRFKLEETLEAFETARTGAGGAIKVMVACHK